MVWYLCNISFIALALLVFLTLWWKINYLIRGFHHRIFNPLMAKIRLILWDIECMINFIEAE